MGTDHAAGAHVPTDESEVRLASHDRPVPEALVVFMGKDWATARPPAVVPAERAPWCARRRSTLSSRFPGEWLVVPAGPLKVRANDTHYRYRPEADFVWLTGHGEPDSVIVLRPSGDGHDATLYARPRLDRSTPAFFADRTYGELWVGPQPSLDEVAGVLGIRTAPPADLAAALEEAADGPVRVLRGVDAAVDGAVPEPATRGADAELATVLAELRLVKDDHEVACLEAAVAATIRGFEDVVRALPAASGSDGPAAGVGVGERWVEGTFDRRARAEGNDVGYGTIAAAGAHACILHWTRNDGPVRPGELLLLDDGVEGPELYTADVTRTLPVSGRYSPEQREVYDVVWRAQAAALAECGPGRPFLAPHRAATRVMAEWLVDIGVLADLDEVLDETHQYHRRYTLHGTSHMLGLDVHDCAQAREETYRGGDLAPGMVLTVEPGLYFQPDDLTVPERYRGIGVRIEDDVLVTADGHRVLTAALPKEAADVEAWMAEVAATG